MSAGILHIFASPTWGGGEQYVYDLVQKQRAVGYRVALVSAPSNAIRAKIEDIGAPYFVLKNRGRFNPFSILRLRCILLHEKINVVHVHQFKDAFIAVFASLLISASRRPRIVLTRHLVRRGKNSFLYRWLYKRLHKLIFVSELARKTFLEKVQLPSDKTVVIYNSIPQRIPALQTVNYRAQYAITADYLLVGFLGRIIDFKGVELLLEAAEIVQDKKVAFLLAGSGEKKYEIHLQKLIAEKKLDNRFFLLGFLECPEGFIRQMDIGVLPSLCVESFGLTVLEFMQAGVPTIATNTGAQPEFVQNEKTGLLVAPTIEEVANALTELINDEPKRKRIGENAKYFCQQNFSYDVFFTKIIKEYGL